MRHMQLITAQIRLLDEARGSANDAIDIEWECY